MFKSILFTLSILLVFQFPASAQRDFIIKNEQVIVSDFKTSALNNDQSIVTDGEQAVIIISRRKDISLSTIDQNKNVSKERILEFPESKMVEIEQVYFNPQNKKAYVVLKTVYTLRIKYYLQQADVFKAKLVGKQMELGEFKMPSYEAGQAYRLAITFGDNGDVQVRTVTRDGKKGFPFFNITSFKENLEPIGTYSISFARLESKYKSVKVIAESFRDNQFYFMLSVTPEDDAGLGKFERSVLHVTDLDGKQILHKMVGGLSEKEETDTRTAKFLFQEDNLYITTHYVEIKGRGKTYADADFFFYLAKFNTLNNEFDYEERINLKKLVTQPEGILFDIGILKEFSLAKIDAPKVYPTSDGLVLIAQSFNTFIVDNFQYRRSDLLIKVNNEGKFVKSAIIKKSTAGTFQNPTSMSVDYKENKTYFYGKPLYYQHENGSIIQFFITNPSEPKPEKIGAVKFKNLNSDKAKSHYVIISPDLKVSNPVDAQTGPTNSKDAPFISEYQSCIMKSPDGKGDMIVNFVKNGSKLHVSFTTIEGN